MDTEYRAPQYERLAHLRECVESEGSRSSEGATSGEGEVSAAWNGDARGLEALKSIAEGV